MLKVLNAKYLIIFKGLLRMMRVAISIKVITNELTIDRSHFVSLDDCNEFNISTYKLARRSHGVRKHSKPEFSDPKKGGIW